MKHRLTSLLFSGLLLAGLPVAGAVAGGCSSDTAATTKPPGKLCTPGNFVFCRCADRTDGTKLCKEDGESFEACMLGEDIPCSGGELPPDDAGTEEDAETSDTGGASSPETCPGKAISVSGTADTLITGDTTAAASDYGPTTGACAVAATSPDHVYALIATASGRVTASLTMLAPFDGTLYVRASDCAAGRQLGCGETGGAGGAETVNFNAIVGETYYVFVDGKAGSKGQYSLNLKLVPGPFCGDGKLDTGEGCDEGLKNGGVDACGFNCAPSGNPPAGNACPGQVAHVWGGTPINITGSTDVAGYGDGAKALPDTPSCVGGAVNPVGNVSNDHVYAVTAHKTGTMTVSTTGSTFNVALYARSTCATQSTELKCVNLQGTTAPVDETMSFAVTSGSTYYVFVDGRNGSKGTYTLNLSIP